MFCFLCVLIFHVVFFVLYEVVFILLILLRFFRIAVSTIRIYVPSFLALILLCRFFEAIFDLFELFGFLVTRIIIPSYSTAVNIRSHNFLLFQFIFQLHFLHLYFLLILIFYFKYFLEILQIWE